MTTVLPTGNSGLMGTCPARRLVSNTDDRIVALVRGKDDHGTIDNRAVVLE